MKTIQQISEPTKTDNNSSSKLSVKDWIPTIVATIITIILTIAVAWYTVDRNEKQSILAEQERANNVKNNLVSIIEEHILNQKILDINRINRLIENRIKEEKVTSKIFVNDLFQQAEYNILNSRYLDFNKKGEYKLIFDTIYQTIIPIDSTKFSSFKYASLLNEIADKIESQQKKEAIELLVRLSQSYESDILPKRKDVAFNDIIKELGEKPFELTLFIILYILFIYFFMFRRNSVFRKMLLRLLNR
jgi:preprotein translocase subunit YajC